MNSHRTGHAQPQQPVVPMGQVLMMAPQSDVLSGDVINRLDRAWMDRPAAEIAEMGPFDIARELLAILPDGEGFSNDLRLRVAEELVALLGRFGFRRAAEQSATPVATVRIERNPDEMSLEQLLELIVADPHSYARVKRYIIGHPELRRAAAKTYEWVLVDDGKINLRSTLDYVTQLSETFARPQTRVDGRRPVSLDRAMGVNTQPLIHPITGRLVQGPDDNGFDWSEIDRELIEAVLWARKTGHAKLPDLESDVYGYSEQLFERPLSRRFEEILADYRDAKSKGVSTTDGIRAEWPEDLPYDATYTFVVRVAVVDYETVVRANLLGTYQKRATNLDVRRGPYSTISAVATNITFHGTVIIGGGSVSATNADGKIFAAPGTRVNVSATNDDVEIITLSWEKIARKLGLI